MRWIVWMLNVGLVLLSCTACNKADVAVNPDCSPVSSGEAEKPPTPKAETKPESASNDPVLQFDKTVYDFGTVSKAESVSGKFTFRNAGRATLKLEPPEPACGCTEATLKSDTLQPGESGELNFTLALGNVRTHLEKGITVKSNDPKNPKMELTLRADYTPLYEIMPTMLRMEVLDSVETNVTLQVTRTDGKNLNMKSLRSPTHWITADFSGADQTPTGTVKLKIDAKGAGGSFANYVRFYSDDTNKPVASIFAVLNVLGDVSFSPEMLYWGITPETRKQPPEQLMTRRLVVTPTVPGTEFELFNPTITFTNANLELIPTEKGKKYEIVIKLSELPKKTTTGTLTFQTSLPKQPRVYVPMSVKVVD